MGELSYTIGNSTDNIASFKSAARVPITSTKVHFTKKQNLHGYSKPWIGGTGKNLFNINSSEQDPSNIDIYNNSIRIFTPGTYTRCASWSNYRDPSRILDFSILGNIMTVKSTTGYGVGYAITILPETQYAISAIVDGVGASINIAYYDSNGNFLSEAANETNVANSVITTPSNSTIAVLIFRGTYSDTAVTFANIQFEKSSSITSYEPYENICPIERWDNVEIHNSGINLLNKAKCVIGKRYVSDGTITNQAVTSISELMPVVPNSKYYILNAKSDGMAPLYWFDKNKKFLNFGYAGNVSGSGVVTSPANAGYLGINISTDLIDSAAVNCIENDESYHPYEGYTISITFPVLGKNKFNWNVEQSHSTPVGSDPQNARTFIPNTYVIGMSVNNYYRDNYTNWVLNPSVENGVIHIESGAASGYGIAFPLELVPGQTYFLSGTRPVGEGSLGVSYYDKDGKQISYNNDRLGKTITIPENAVITLIGFYATSSNSTFEFSNIQLELGTSATTYEPYDSSSTICGGYIDAPGGEIVAEELCINLKWSDFGKSYGDTFINTVRGNYDLKYPAKLVHYLAKCNLVDYNYSWGLDKVHFYIGPDPTNRIYINLPPDTDDDTDIQVTYYLLNPIHCPISKHNITTLLGQNVVWSDTNAGTEVSYAIHDVAPIRAAKHRIVVNEPHIETVNGSMVHFNTDIKAPLKSCKVYFNPVQEGSGDPSPSNVRTISGWTGFEVCKTGKNLFNINANWQNLLSTYKYAKMLPNELCRIRFIPKNLSVDLTGYSLGFVYFEPSSIAQANKGYNWVMENGVIKADNRLHNKVVGGDYSGLYCQYIFVYPGTDEALNAITSAYDIEIEPDNLNTNYEPYIGTALPLNWSSTAGTIYGGYVDLVNREVVNCWRYITLNSDYNVYVSGGSYRGTTCTDAWFDIQSIGYTTSYAQNQTSDDIQCDKFALVSKAIWGDPDTYPWKCVLNSYNQLHCVFVNDVVGITSEDSNTVAIAKIKTWIDENPVNVAYRVSGNLITHHPLSTTALKTLRGINNIWSTANDSIDISYWKH